MVAKLSRLDVDSDPLIICEDDARCVIPKLIFTKFRCLEIYTDESVV